MNNESFLIELDSVCDNDHCLLLLVDFRTKKDSTVRKLDESSIEIFINDCMVKIYSSSISKSDWIKVLKKCEDKIDQLIESGFYERGF